MKKSIHLCKHILVYVRKCMEKQSNFISFNFETALHTSYYKILYG
jgi:hypothetical protein